MSDIKFGTGGWRGVIGEEFTKINVQKIAFSTLDFIGDNGVLIAYDRRFLSERAIIWVMEVLLAYDKKVYIVDGTTPTPVVMHFVEHNNLDLGIMITASHNPYIDNGIKIITKGGIDADVKFTDKLEKIANSVNEIKTIKVDLKNDRKKFYFANPNLDYIESVLKQVDKDQIKKKNLLVAVDNMHGVSHRILPSLLNNLGVRYNSFRDYRDPLFGNQVPNPTRDNLYQLSLEFKQVPYDLGIAIDADGDRIALLDENGKFIHPNTVISLLYRYLLEEVGTIGSVVKNNSTTYRLNQIADKHNQTTIEVDVGFKNISKAMKDSNAIIGGESSGGVTTRNHIKGKDGIFSAILIMDMLSKTEQTLSELVNDLDIEYGKLYYFEADFIIGADSNINIESLKSKFDLNYVEVSGGGLKFKEEDKLWFNIRKSGTENLLRIVIEATKLEDLLNVKEVIIKDLELEVNHVYRNYDI